MSVRHCSPATRKSVRVAIMFAVLTALEIRKRGLGIPSNVANFTCRAKKRKYPDGYPGDAPSSNTSLPVKYSCHKCTKVFPPIPHPDSGIEQPKQDCVRCKHERCSECPRAPPRRIEPEPDPELLKRVEAKLAALNISTTTANA